MAKIRLKRKGLPTVSGSGTLYQGHAPSAPRVKVGQNFIGTGMLQRGGSGMNFSGAGAIQPGSPHQITPPVHQVGQNLGAPPVAPKPAAAPATPPPPMPPVDVRDSDYWLWKTQRRGDIDQQEIAWDAEDANQKAARDEALRRMAIQRPEDLTQANRNFNRQGLFYSGALGKARDDIESEYIRNQASTQDEYTRNANYRQQARQLLESGFSAEDVIQLLAAGDRQAGRDQASADAGGLAGPADPTPAPATGQPGVPGGLVAHPGLGQNFGSPVVQALKNKSKKKHGRGGGHQYGR